MKIIIDSRENIDKLVADKISECVAEKADAAIAFAAGESTKGIYKELTNKNCSFKDVSAFNICEYVGLDEGDEHTCANEVDEALYSKVGITKIHTPTEENAENFDDEIAKCGGLDLIVLGIGLNGHIGFNEPATLFDTKTHVQQLTDSTRRMKAEKFGGEDKAPTYGVTMGLKTIFSAKNVILCASGAEKADIVYKLVYGKTTTYVPAAMLQMHMNMILCLDKEAASKL